MGSLSTRRVVRRSAPAKITIVDGKGCGGDAADKENMVNCSLYSLFESHYERSNNSPLKAPPREPASGPKDRPSTVLQPRKRGLNERTPPLPNSAEEHSRELTPPELTTSDTFKPAKRTLPPIKKPVEDEGIQMQHLRKVKIPVRSTNESCDVLFSSPTELTNSAVSEFHHCRAPTTGRRDVAKKTPKKTPNGRRLSIVRLSIAKEGAAVLPISKKDGNSTVKKNAPTGENADGCPMEPNGKHMIFSAVKLSPVSEQTKNFLSSGERSRTRVLERRKSIGFKMIPLGKQGIGSYGGKSDLLKRVAGSEKMPPAPAQLANSAPKNTSESVRTGKLAMVLKSEQKLAEQNEQYRIQLRQLQGEIEERDHEVENLRSAALLLNTLNNRQSEEIRELRCRLKETFNENAEVRHVCETLERDLRKTRESLTLERIQQAATKSCAPSWASLTSQLQSMSIRMETPMIETCIDEGQEETESQDGSEDQPDSRHADDTEAQDVPADVSTSIEDMPPTQKDQDVLLTLEDLQDMVKHEEEMLKERCAEALRELNLPLKNFLTAKGSLDVASLKAVLVMLASKEENFTSERIISIRKLSTWLGLS